MADFTASTAAITALFSGLAGIIGAVVGKKTNAKVEPVPLPVKLDEKFAGKESNAEAHREIFLRLSAVEQAVSAIRAENNATRDSLVEIKTQLRDMNARLLEILKGIKLS